MNNRTHIRTTLSAITMSLMMVVLAVMSIACGSVNLPIGDVADVLTGNSDNLLVEYIVMNVRLPQTITAIMAGAALSVSGLMLQTAFHNPLAGPSVLGISNGASLGVALVVLASGGLAQSIGGMVATTMAALIGALAVTALLMAISATINSQYTLLIAGLMLGYLISSVITLLTYSATEKGVMTYVVWGMGSFTGVTLRQSLWMSAGVITMLVISLPMAKSLNVMQLGERYAENLGVSMKRLRLMLLLVTGILSAVVTAFCGPIGFIGLAVPHIVRMIAKSDNFLILMPMTIITGAVVALICNIICTLPSDSIIPLAAVTPMVGAPVILFIILKQKTH